MTGMEHVPSDTSGDLHSRNSKRIETCTLAFIGRGDSRNLLTSSKDSSDLAERLVIQAIDQNVEATEDTDISASVRSP